MKDAFWFQHDSNARNDVRLLELRAELGWEGYGLWWALIEQLRESADYRLSNDKLGGLAMGMGVPKKQLESLLALCFDLCLLDLEDGYFFAPALCRRMEAWDTKRAALAEAGKRGAARRWAGDKPPDAEPVPPQSPPDSHPNSQAISHPNAGPVAIREENIREEKSTEEVPLPSVEEAAPQKKIELEQVSESPATELRTPGGAADAGALPPEVKLTKRRGGKQLMRDSPLAEYPAFVVAWDAAAAANPATYVDFVGVNLVHYHAALLDWSNANGQKKADWLATIRGSVRRDYDAGRLRKAGQQPQQANPQQHAVNRSSYGSQPNGAAARLQTPQPDASSPNPWGLPAYTAPASVAALPGGH